jgi:hypothetical protein
LTTGRAQPLPEARAANGPRFGRTSSGACAKPLFSRTNSHTVPAPWQIGGVRDIEPEAKDFVPVPPTALAPQVLTAYYWSVFPPYGPRLVLNSMALVLVAKGSLRFSTATGGTGRARPGDLIAYRPGYMAYTIEEESAYCGAAFWGGSGEASPTFRGPDCCRNTRAWGSAIASASAASSA